MEYKIREKLFGANKASASGTSLTLNNTVKYPINKLTIDGVCEQKTTTGKNFLPDVVDKTAKVSNGITLTVLENNQINLKGTSTGTAIFDLQLKESIKILKDIYIHLRNNSSNSSTAIAFLTDSNVQFGWKAFSTINRIDKLDEAKDELEISILRMQVNAGQTIDITCQPSLEYTPNTTDYEPYTGGQPSPSPDYPQEIKTITGNLKLTSCEKNLFDSSFRKANGTLTVAHGTGTEISGIFTLKATGADIYLFDLLNPSYFYNEACGPLIEIPKNNNGKLFFENTNSLFTKNYITQYDENKKSIGTSYISSNVGYATIKSNAKYCSIRTGYSKSVANEEYKFSIMVSINDIPYEPYQSSSLNITIPENEFVGKIDDTYKDTLNVVYKNDGHYHLILNKKLGGIDLNKLTWQKISTGLGFIRYTTSEIQNLKYASKNTELGVGLTEKYLNHTGQGMSAKDAKNHFAIDVSVLQVSTIAEPSGKLIYALKTPYEVDLGIVDQLLTFDEITNIFTDSDLYPVINVDYYKGSLDISNYEFSIKEV